MNDMPPQAACPVQTTRPESYGSIGSIFSFRHGKTALPPPERAAKLCCRSVAQREDIKHQMLGLLDQEPIALF